jgi:protein-tyrosine phosphatase
MTILMVCLGNICRSPLAEGILQQKCKEAGLNWKIDSAGTNGFHNGEAPHFLSQKVASLNGVNISGQQSRQFIQEDFKRFDKIYAMALDIQEEIKEIGKDQFISSKVDLLMNEVYPGQNKEVPDPFYGAEDGYHRVYEMIEIACDAIIKNHAN